MLLLGCYPDASLLPALKVFYFQGIKTVVCSRPGAFWNQSTCIVLPPHNTAHEWQQSMRNKAREKGEGPPSHGTFLLRAPRRSNYV